MHLFYTVLCIYFQPHTALTSDSPEDSTCAGVVNPVSVLENLTTSESQTMGNSHTPPAQGKNGYVQGMQLPEVKLKPTGKFYQERLALQTLLIA